MWQFSSIIISRNLMDKKNRESDDDLFIVGLMKGAEVEIWKFWEPDSHKQQYSLN